MENTKVVVMMDGEETSSTDFVAILARENGDTSVFYNTDALTLGMSIKLLAKQFVESMAQCTEEERTQVSAILGDAFVVEAATVNGQN